MDTKFLPSLDYQRYIDMCYDIARGSTCSKARFGSVIVSNTWLLDGTIASPPREVIVGRGTNHSPNPACEDCASLCAGKLRLGVKSGTRIELCYAVHAEQWALLEAGPKANGAVIFVTGFDGKWEKNLKKDPTLPEGHPNRGFYCSMCARLMWAAGIKHVVCDSVLGSPVIYTVEDVWNSSYIVADSIQKAAA